ncbi:MerR family transcriptional regulator, partial [Faecalicatena contorta]|nr:MerR family transcriptional regulator [Faecalicatena contorta]
LPISTLRYYDKEGFFPNLMRKGNIRYFSDDELEAIRVIECLKRSGLEIKDIKQFFLFLLILAQDIFINRFWLFTAVMTLPFSKKLFDIVRNLYIGSIHILILKNSCTKF